MRSPPSTAGMTKRNRRAPRRRSRPSSMRGPLAPSCLAFDSAAGATTTSPKHWSSPLPRPASRQRALGACPSSTAVSAVVDFLHYPPFTPTCDYDREAIDKREHNHDARFAGQNPSDNRKHQKPHPIYASHIRRYTRPPARAARAAYEPRRTTLRSGLEMIDGSISPASHPQHTLPHR